MIAAGAAVALPCLGALGRLVESQLFGVTATDPITVAGTTLLLAASALAAAFVPAYAASTVSPPTHCGQISGRRALSDRRRQSTRRIQTAVSWKTAPPLATRARRWSAR
jgi:hypothetical protein